MPPLYEGDLLYMPTTFPGISPTKARELLQQTDRIIRSFPEVQEVFGKMGRAETATDPAPMDMIETTITLKPEHAWPAIDIVDDAGRVVAHRRRTVDELTHAMNAAVQIPGLTNAWTMPIKTRVDMLATGIKTPVGIKVAGPDLAALERIASEIEGVVHRDRMALAIIVRNAGGRYLVAGMRAGAQRDGKADQRSCHAQRAIAVDGCFRCHRLRPCPASVGNEAVGAAIILCRIGVARNAVEAIDAAQKVGLRIGSRGKAVIRSRQILRSASRRT